MKLVKRAAGERGHTTLAWLDSRHTFSFGSYQDPAQLGFRALRVINEDLVEPGGGFGEHAHRDAEILSYVIEGRLQHRDSLGNGSVIEAGDLQYMSAGDGVRHSEFNPSQSERVHFLQIWLLPDSPGGAPRYAEKRRASAVNADHLTLLYTGSPRESATALRTDANVFLAKLSAGARVRHRTEPQRGVWIQLVSGIVRIGGETLAAGDGAAIENAYELELHSPSAAELLLFDLA
jgi:redox-sensitive bicupin YhaK (pirin superfamily)